MQRAGSDVVVGRAAFQDCAEVFYCACATSAIGAQLPTRETDLAIGSNRGKRQRFEHDQRFLMAAEPKQCLDTRQRPFATKSAAREPSVVFIQLGERVKRSMIRTQRSQRSRDQERFRWTFR